MAENTTLEVEKQEVTTTDDVERTRANRCFAPLADIYELSDQIIIVADVPGASEKDIDITLEKNVLTINVKIETEPMEGKELIFAEYEVGDYQRSFKFSDEIDRTGIQATVKDGILRLFLPKAPAAQVRKIDVKSA